MNEDMREYTCNYHRTPTHKVGTATIAVPEESATPLEDALSLAKQTAPGGTVFLVLLYSEGTIRESRVVFTSSPLDAYR